MKKHLLLWLATAALAVLLAVLVPRVEPVATPVAPPCSSTPDAQGFAWTQGGRLICPFTPAAAPHKS